MGPWVALLGATILTVAANAGLIGVSRLAFSMSHSFLIHPIFRHTPRGFRTPVYSLVFFGGLGALVMAFFPYLEVLADLYNYGAMLSFTMTHLALIRLRKIEPDLPRPYRVPLSFKVKGYDIPLPTLVGLLGTGSVFAMVLVFHKYGRVFGTLWMIGGIVYYYFYRKSGKMPLMDRLSVIDIPSPPPSVEDRHGGILVATSPSAPSPLLSDVLKVAKSDGARVLVVTVLEVPLALPLYAPLPAEEETARQTLALCQAMGVERDVLVDTQLLRGRSAGDVLVRILRREKMDTLVLGDTDSAIARTIEATVLRADIDIALWKIRRRRLEPTSSNP